MYKYFNQTVVAAAAPSAAMEAVNHSKNSAIVEVCHEWHKLSPIDYVYISVNSCN